MILLAAAAGLSVADCEAFRARAAEPMSIAVEIITGERLGGRPAQQPPGTTMPRSTLGPFVYAGQGMLIRSKDPRFRQIKLDNWRRHPCGYVVVGPSAGNIDDKDRSRWAWTFERDTATELPPGLLALEEQHSIPLLAGYQAGAAWPVYAPQGQYFIGLMHSRSKDNETIIVAFSQKAGPSPARILARVPLWLDSVTVVPALHHPHSTLNLLGWQPDGAIAEIGLDFSAEADRMLAEEFGPAPVTRR